MPSSVRVCPVDGDSLGDVALFLHEQLNGRLSAEQWARAIVPPWRTDADGHGVCLRDGDAVVGVYLTFTSRREVGASTRRICNLAAWCVADDYRPHALRLLRALLASGADVYTDLSPSGSVVSIDERLGFRRLDTTTSLRVNLPTVRPRNGPEVVTDGARIAELLTGRDAEIFRDHRDAAAAHHVVVLLDGKPCYVVYRRVRRRNLPLFAALVHVGAPRLFPRAVDALGGHLLLRGMPLLLAEHRISGAPLNRSFTVSGRPKLFLSDQVDAADIDDLYSEITCVAW
ncbi:hypothetical protein [Actinotalea sp.]|uniref:hypothetical protein n=1 Tax=Actinotalea sp. TaxID=1872145 RepID=UPI00356482D5